MLVSRVAYSDWLRAGRSGDRIPVGARFSSPVQTGPGANPTTFTKGTGSFPGVKSGPGVTLTPHLLLVPWSRKSRAIPLLPLWAVRPVQSLSACTRVHFTCHAWRGIREEKYYFFILYNEPTNAQLIDSWLYTTIFYWSYIFRHYCVIFRELIVSTLQSYAIMSVQP